MEISFSPTEKIADLVKDFEKTFPGLSIKLYHHQHADGEGSSNKDMVDFNKTLGQLMSNPISSGLSIDSNTTIEELEKEFHDYYGLNIQVYRRSGDLWLQTMQTDSWTLKKAMEVAAESVSLD